MGVQIDGRSSAKEVQLWRPSVVRNQRGRYDFAGLLTTGDRRGYLLIIIIGQKDAWWWELEALGKLDAS